MFKPGNLLQTISITNLWSGDEVSIIQKDIIDILQKYEFCICLSDQVGNNAYMRYIKVLSSKGIGNVNTNYIRNVR